VTGTVAIVNGGTGTTTAQTAINSLAGAVTSGSYLRGDGTNVVMNTIQVADVPTLNQNTTGTASNVTGTVAVANGGTGATSLTANNVLLGNGTSAVQVVAPGTTGNILTSNGTTWQSTAPAAGGGGSWTYLSTVTASGAATADIESTFDSTYDMYAIVGVDFRPSTAAVNIYCRLKVGGTYRATSYSRISYGNNTNSGGAFVGSQGTAETYILVNTTTAGGTGVVHNGAEAAGFFIMYIQKPARTGAHQSVFGDYIYTPEDAGATLAKGSFAGAYKGGYGALTGVRILASSGNINGTFRLYGIKNS
jgi:hypothetical protein